MIKNLLLLLLLIPCLAMAQSSGKIVGSVTDKATGEPLPGVNILVEGTGLGGATDLDGYYIILNVPVSTYYVRASFIGYQDVEIQNLRVSTDLTTQADFSMQPTQLELGETIIVTAQRPLVQKNVTSSVSLVTGEEIQNITVRGMDNIASLTAGVVDQDGLHIRGSRNDEVGYVLGGVNTTDVYSGGTTIGVIQEAVEEFQVLAGGYTAEYGNANGGIIKTELRGGTPKFKAMIDFHTDKIVDNGDKFLGTYSYGWHNLVGTISGPLLTNNLKYFVAFENTQRSDTKVRFSEGWSFNDLVDDGVSNRRPDTLSLSYPDGFTPRNRLSRNTLNGTISWDFAPMQLRIGGSYMHSNTKNDNNPQLNFLNTRQAENVADSYLLSARFTHILNPKTFYNVDIGYTDYFRETEDPYFGNNWRLFSDSVANAREGIQFETRWNHYPGVFLNGFTFARDGAPPGYSRDSQSQLNFGVDFISQFNKYNELKAGISYQAYTIRHYEPFRGSSGAMAGVWDSETQTSREFGDLNNDGKIDVLDDISFGRLAGAINYGYDVHGNESDDKGIAGMEGPRQPSIFAAYISDKLEFKDLIVNAGLRMDYYQTADMKFTQPRDPQVDVINRAITDETYEEVDPITEFSPRLGFSFPASETTVFYTQYGKFVQMPRFNQLYNSWWEVSHWLTSDANGTAPVGVDPIRTTSYEIGYRQQISDKAAFDVSLFYKNIRGQLQYRLIPVDPQATASSYGASINSDFATTRGLELRFRLRRVERTQMRLNYTYSKAEGTASTENQTQAISNDPAGNIFPTVVRPLDFARTHKGNVILDYRFGPDEGGPVFKNLGAYVIFNFASGRPYTKTFTSFTGQQAPSQIGVVYINDTRQRTALEQLNASETPWTINFDLRVDKTFRIADMLDANLYVNVQNLFNRKNINYVYPFTGSDKDDGLKAQTEVWNGYVTAFGPEYEMLYDAINGKNHGAMLVTGSEIYQHPRQIWLGLKLIF